MIQPGVVQPYPNQVIAAPAALRQPMMPYPSVQMAVASSASTIFPNYYAVEQWRQYYYLIQQQLAQQQIHRACAAQIRRERQIVSFSDILWYFKENINKVLFFESLCYSNVGSLTIFHFIFHKIISIQHIIYQDSTSFLLVLQSFLVLSHRPWHFLTITVLTVDFCTYCDLFYLSDFFGDCLKLNSYERFACVFRFVQEMLKIIILLKNNLILGTCKSRCDGTAQTKS